LRKLFTTCPHPSEIDKRSINGKPFFFFGRFSVSKWIHLNGGDAGLRRFFERVYAALDPGGTFVLEAQPRESYIKARKLHPVSAFTFLRLWLIQCVPPT